MGDSIAVSALLNLLETFLMVCAVLILSGMTYRVWIVTRDVMVGGYDKLRDELQRANSYLNSLLYQQEQINERLRELLKDRDKDES